MKLISGLPYWPEHSGTVPRYLPLREHAACEIAVIGGGYTPRYRHAIFAVGVGGNGMISSVLAARFIRDAFLCKKTPDTALFRFLRPSSRFR